MPQRFLRPGITTSDAWNAVSFPAQSLYIRILTLVDDFGRYDGRAAILHGQCFALRTDIKPQQTAALCQELHAAGMVDFYAADGKEFLQITRWKERARAEKSLYPDKPQDSAADGSATQLSASSIVPRSSFSDHRSSAVEPPAAQQTPEDFIAELEATGGYPGIDLHQQLGRMKAWLLTPKGKGRQLTKRFMVNWLSKADAPLLTSQTTPKPQPRHTGEILDDEGQDYNL